MPNRLREQGFRRISFFLIVEREIFHTRKVCLWQSCEYEEGRTAVENKAERHSQTIPHLAMKQVDPTAESTAGWRGERCIQVRPTCSGPEQKQLGPRAGWARAQRNGSVQVAWRTGGTSGESKLQNPRPDWSLGSRAPWSGGVQLSWTAELAQPSEKPRKWS